MSIEHENLEQKGRHDPRGSDKVGQVAHLISEDASQVIGRPVEEVASHATDEHPVKEDLAMQGSERDVSAGGPVHEEQVTNMH